MLSNDEFNSIIGNIRSVLPEETQALISDSLTTLMANQSASVNALKEANDKIEEITKLNEDLLLTNGKLFQKIGSQTTNPDPDILEDKPKEEVKIKLEDIINEKGEII